jgi:hypothetical protein
MKTPWWRSLLWRELGATGAVLRESVRLFAERNTPSAFSHGLGRMLPLESACETMRDGVTASVSRASPAALHSAFGTSRCVQA